MARPCKSRKICFPPECTIFKPAGIPTFELEDTILTVDEFESLRLADLDGMYQENAAREMGISRQTFGNILKKAHHKIAEAIVRGKAIKIEGGAIKMEGKRIFSCRSCQHEWEISYGTGRPAHCPTCNSKNIHRSHKDPRCGRRQRLGHKHGGSTK